MGIFLKILPVLIILQIVYCCKIAERKKYRPKLYGGYKANNNEFLHQVGVALSFLWYTQVICSGSLLTNRLIITAAHCLDQYRSLFYGLYILVGNKNLKSNRGTWYEIGEIFKYPKWVKKVLEYDVILLKTKDKIELIPGFVEVVKLPGPDSYIPMVDDRVWTCGWGLITEDERAESLKKIDLYIVSEERCNKTWGTTRDKRICVVSKRRGWGTCDGDSGGGLIYNERLIGILSYGTVSCDLNQPEVYSDLHSYLDWINSIMNKNDW